MALMVSCSLTYFKRKLVGWKQEFDNRDLSRSQGFMYVFASISPFILKKKCRKARDRIKHASVASSAKAKLAPGQVREV